MLGLLSKSEHSHTQHVAPQKDINDLDLGTKKTSTILKSSGHTDVANADACLRLKTVLSVYELHLI